MMRSCTAYLYADRVIFATCDPIPSEDIRSVWEGVVASRYDLPGWLPMEWFRRECRAPHDGPDFNTDSIIVRVMIGANLN